MIGVVGRYSYEVKRECFVADMPDFLLGVTKDDDPPWRTRPAKQLYQEGTKGGSQELGCDGRSSASQSDVLHW